MKTKDDTQLHKELALGKHCSPWQMGSNSLRKHAKFLKELCFHGEPRPICLEEPCFGPIFPKQLNVFEELGLICP